MTSSWQRALAAIVAAVALLNTLSALSMPVAERAASRASVAIWLVLLLAHAGLYWFGDRVRARFGLVGYVGAQALVLFLLVVSRASVPVSTALWMACTVEIILVARPRWHSAAITTGAIVLFVLALLVARNLYFATTAGLALALAGVLGHAIAALLQRPGMVAASPAPVPAPYPASPTSNGTQPSGLSAREAEVLRELVRGARNSDIAATLGITERTVKSHLKSIYQKLGVESRSAAVALAVQRHIV